MRKLNNSGIAQKRRAIMSVAKELGIEVAAVRALARMCNVSAKKIVTRLRALAERKVPLKGLRYKLSLSEKDFEALLVRFESKHKLNKGQQKLFDFMRKKGVSVRIAVKIASNKAYHAKQIPEKIAFFESFKLDPKVYGVTKIPVKYYQVALETPLNELRKGIKKRVLMPLEDAHAEKLLDDALPGWRNVKTFFLTRPKGRKMRPAKIRRMIVELSKAGLPLRTDYIATSVETARKRGANVTPSGYAKVLEGSDIKTGPGKKKGAREQVSIIETQIGRINSEIVRVQEKMRRSITYQAIDNIRITELQDRRRELIGERDQLLVR
jgi:hypothetical protein